MEKKGYWKKLEKEYKEDPSKVEVLENLKKSINIYVDCKKISNYSTLLLEKALVNTARDALSQDSADDHENNLIRIPESMKTTVRQWSYRQIFN
jgi:chaperonin GroEL (HSP60 family)